MRRAVQKNRDRIDGVIVTLPNFGDERAIANTLRLADLGVPVLVQATPDAAGKMTIAVPARQLLRQDVGLQQPAPVRHSLLADQAAHREPRLARSSPRISTRFAADVPRRQGAAGTCGSAASARGRPPSTPCATARRFSRRNGISVETVDLSEIIGRIEQARRRPSGVRAKLEEIRAYTPTAGVPEPALIKMAKLGFVIDDWMRETDVRISAVQCWTAMEEYFGVVPCTVMSMMSNELMSSACEVGHLRRDRACTRWRWRRRRRARCSTGTTTTATIPTRPSASIAATCPSTSSRRRRMDYQEILAGTVGKENTLRHAGRPGEGRAR